ncbi:hypothetical protein REC12_22060 [Desulfosporosinus sp. PR]|nr:hypothetical protein [Desulfosporosinus sp. PR]
MGANRMLLFAAYTEIGLNIAALTYYCGPVIVIILSQVMFREKMTSAKLCG